MKTVRVIRFGLCLFAFAALLLAKNAHAACSGYPAGVTDETRVLSIVLNGVIALDSIKPYAVGVSSDGLAGQLTYDSTNNALVLCNGTSWQTLLSAATSSQWVDGASGAIYYNGGNVGIGTTTPSKTLAVAGSAAVSATATINGTNSIFNVSSNSNSDKPAMYVSGGGDAAGEHVLVVNGRSGSNFAADVLRVSTNMAAGTGFNLINTVLDEDGTPSYPFVVRGDGNVGIGISTPARLLTLYEATTPVLQLTNSTAGTAMGDGGLIYFTGNDLNLRTAESSGNLIIQTGGTTERVRVDSNGNVGIGTTSPGQKLDVVGSIKASAGFFDAAAASPGGTGFYLAFGGSNPAAGPAVRWSDGTNANTIGLYVNGGLNFQGGSGNNYFSIRQTTTDGTLGSIASRFSGDGTASYINALGGNVGIGTTSPNTTTQIVKTSAGAATTPLSLMNVGGTNGSEVALELDPTATGLGSRVAQVSALTNGSNQVSLLFKTSDASPPVERMRITAAGNVGIGTTSAPQKLTVAGGIAWYGNDYGGYSYPVCHSSNSNPTTLGWCSSSRKYKKNIEPLNLGLETVMKLRPVTFDWKNREEHDLGLIAEDVADVEPLLAEYDADNKPRSVKYAHLTALLTKAIQELKADNDNLRDIVERQGREIETIKAALH